MRFRKKTTRAIPWRAIATWALSFAILAGLVGLAVSVAFGPYFRVQTVLVENLTSADQRAGRESHLSVAELRHLSNIRQGSPLWAVDNEKAVQQILRHPWVRTANVVARWPDTIEIQVEEHVPCFLLEHRGLYYVNAEGEIFKRARNDDLDYPVLTGIDGDLADYQGGSARRVLEQAVGILQAIEQAGEFQRVDLSELHFDRWNGFDLILRSGTVVCMGFVEPPKALDRLHRMRLAGLDPSVPQRIDLASDKLAVVTPYLKPELPTEPAARAPTSPPTTQHP